MRTTMPKMCLCMERYIAIVFCPRVLQLSAEMTCLCTKNKANSVDLKYTCPHTAVALLLLPWSKSIKCTFINKSINYQTSINQVKGFSGNCPECECQCSFTVQVLHPHCNSRVLRLSCVFNCIVHRHMSCFVLVEARVRRHFLELLFH